MKSQREIDIEMCGKELTVYGADKPSSELAGSAETKFEEKCERWRKKYNCTPGEAVGWCDGENAKRCPRALNTGDGYACELAL